MNNAENNHVASIILAAGKGSRMIGYEGNKTLLPLIPRESLYEGDHPLLIEVLQNLPSGPKGIVVHHRADDVEEATRSLGVSYLFQPETNGTGGALLAARPFLESVTEEVVVITMGDVPLIRSVTYAQLVRQLERYDLAILAFEPQDRAQYGMIEMKNDRVLRIVEWKYWHTYPEEQQAALRFCNAGVYAARRPILLSYLDRLAAQPHEVRKQRGEQWVTIREYFLTDLVEMMNQDDRPVGVTVAPEEEVTGVDHPEALRHVQIQYASRKSRAAER